MGSRKRNNTKSSEERIKSQDKSFPKRNYFKKSAKHLGILAICIGIVSLGLGLAFLLIDILKDKGLDGWGVLEIAAIAAGVIVIIIGSFAIYASRHPYDNCLYRTTIGLFIVYCLIALAVIGISLFAIIMLLQCEDHHFVFDGGKVVRLETNNCPQQLAGIIIAAILMFIWFLVPVMLSAVLLYRLFYALCPKRKSKKPFESVYLPKGQYKEYQKDSPDSSTSNIYVNTRQNPFSRSSNSSLYSSAYNSFKRSWNSFIKRSETNSNVSEERYIYKEPHGKLSNLSAVKPNTMQGNTSYSQTKTYHQFTKTYTLTPNPIETTTNITSPIVNQVDQINISSNQTGHVNRSFEYSEHQQNNIHKPKGNWQLFPDSRRKSIDSEIQDYERKISRSTENDETVNIKNIQNFESQQPIEPNINDFAASHTSREEVIRNLHSLHQSNQTHVYNQQASGIPTSQTVPMPDYPNDVNSRRSTNLINVSDQTDYATPPYNGRREDFINNSNIHMRDHEIQSYQSQRINDRPTSPATRDDGFTRSTNTYTENWHASQQQQQQQQGYIPSPPPLSQRSNSFDMLTSASRQQHHQQHQQQAYTTSQTPLYQRSNSFDMLSSASRQQRHQQQVYTTSPPPLPQRSHSFDMLTSQNISRRQDISNDLMNQQVATVPTNDSRLYKSGSISNLVEENSVRTVTEVSGVPPGSFNNDQDPSNLSYSVKRVEEKVTVRKVVMENPNM